VLLHEGGGVIELLQSTFKSNYATNSTDGIGITNLGGEVQCEPGSWFPVCTAVFSPPPTPEPTAGWPRQSPPSTPQPTVVAAMPVSLRSGTNFMMGPVVSCLGLALLVVGVAISWRREAWRHRVLRCFGLEPNGGTVERQMGEIPSNQQPFIQCEDASESMELVARSFMSSYEVSPAPVFAVCPHAVRITLWSPGMTEAVPMVSSPMGCLLSELPFVNTSDGDRLHRMLVQIFEAHGEHDTTRTFMLNFKHVLLEATATHVFVAESEPIVLMTCRRVDSALSGLMACESVVALSETNHDVNEEEEDDRFGSASQAGSVGRGNDAHAALDVLAVARAAANVTARRGLVAGGAAHGDNRDTGSDIARSTISSATTLSLLDPPSKASMSSVSSLTMATGLGQGETRTARPGASPRDPPRPWTRTTPPPPTPGATTPMPVTNTRLLLVAETEQAPRIADIQGSGIPANSSASDSSPAAIQGSGAGANSSASDSSPAAIQGSNTPANSPASDLSPTPPAASSPASDSPGGSIPAELGRRVDREKGKF
jgi:hypothetical protein